MTILLAVAMHDCVVVMADGRRANPIEIITDIAEKVVPLNTRLTLAVAGAEIGTNLAEGILRNGMPESAQGIESHLKGVARLSVQHVMDLITPETIAQAKVDVALLAAGFDAEGPFIVGGVASNSMAEPFGLLRRVNVPLGEQIVVWGGEDTQSQAYFIERLVSGVKALGDRVRDTQVLIDAILVAGKETVVRTSQLERGIGGRMQYRVVFPTEEPTTGFI